jgi:DNA-binding response OmpR family regulator
MCSPNRILIVDDEPRTRTQYRRALESAGYVVEEAEGGEAALERLGRLKSGFTLLVLSLPWAENLKVVKYINSMGEPVSVVMGLARGNYLDAKAALKLGVIDFLFEPVAPDELRTMVAEVLHRQDAVRSNPVDLAPTAALIATLFDTSLTQAKRALNRREFPQAEMALRQALALDPDSVTALSLLGVLRESGGDRDEAGRCYQAAFRADPSQALARSNMLRLYNSE